MSPTTKRTTQRALLQASLLLALLIATAGIGHSQTASPCLSSQLSAHHETDDQSMGGHISVYYSFRNDSKSPCTLNGTPAVAFFDRAGRRMKINVERDPMQPKEVTLDPGRKAFFGFDYTSCGVQNQAVEHKSRCTSSAKLGFTPPGTKGMVMIREAIDSTDIAQLTPLVATLKEIGVEPVGILLCSATQLSARHEQDDNGMGGRISEYYSFTNISKKPCTLQGPPTVVLIDRAGGRTMAKVAKADPSAGYGGANEPKDLTLAPGGKAFFSIDYTSCAGSNQMSDQKSRCRSSARVGFTVPLVIPGKRELRFIENKDLVMVRESIDPVPWPKLDAVSAVVATLKEFGFEENSTPGRKSKPKPKP